MTLSPGDTLGPYEIVTQAGEGGMGIVYKARDTRLNRFVAIKVLPAGKDFDQDRRLRFLREAQAASALSHPHIVTIYDIGRAGDADYIAMEFVDGTTLDSAIPPNGMKLADLLRYAVQVTDAMDAAHREGIVHRDLKPGNIMVTAAGQVKILDFGLAKVTAPALSADDATLSLRPRTLAGAVMGTAAYMSPEQAEGKPVDARSDIFSLGVILYEMATGRRAFSGDSTASILSAVLRDDPPPVNTVRADLPAELNRLIVRCLRKDPARRFQTAADLKVALQELKEESASGSLTSQTLPASLPPPPARKKYFPLALGAVAILAAAYTFLNRETAPVAPPAISPLTAYAGIEGGPTFSPDGNQIGFHWSGEKDDNFDIYVKLIGPDPPLRLTTDPAPDRDPVWSPDGRAIAFLRLAPDNRWQLMLVPALGGAERKLAGNILARQVSWTPDGQWLAASIFMPDQKTPGISLVPTQSGEIRLLTKPSRPSIYHYSPAISPDGRLLAYVENTDLNINRILLQPLDANYQPQGDPRALNSAGIALGRIAFTADGRDLIVSSDTNRTSTTAYIHRLSVSGDAKPQPLTYLPRAVTSLALSRQGHRMALAEGRTNTNIWSLDLTNPSKPPVKLITSTTREVFPQYSPDGKRIVFYSFRSGTPQIMVANADGGGAIQLTTIKAINNGTPRWSHDGQSITFDSNAAGGFNLYRVRPDGGTPTQLTNDKFSNITASTSRDGRWVYFSCTRTGRREVWKMPASGGPAQQVTTNGGVAPLESPDGQTLYYVKDGAFSGLWKRPVSGGEETQIAPALYRYSYAVTTQGVYYMSSASSGRDSGRDGTIEYYDLAKRTTTRVARMGLPELGLEVSPDGRHLLFAQLDLSAADLVLVDNFR